MCSLSSIPDSARKISLIPPNLYYMIKFVFYDEGKIYGKIIILWTLKKSIFLKRSFTLIIFYFMSYTAILKDLPGSIDASFLSWIKTFLCILWAYQ